jgi:hypothetical protein
MVISVVPDLKKWRHIDINSQSAGLYEDTLSPKGKKYVNTFTHKYMGNQDPIFSNLLSEK